VKAIENCTPVRRSEQEIFDGGLLRTRAFIALLATAWIAAVEQALLFAHETEGLSMYN